MTEYSCGAVVFTRKNGEIRFVLVKNGVGIYGFPKGHMEAGGNGAGNGSAGDSGGNGAGGFLCE